MRRKRTMALCLVAVFAITAAYAASASAAPLYYTSSNTCKKTFGKLTEAGECIIEGKAVKTQEIAFTETGGEALLKGALKITCASNTALRSGGFRATCSVLSEFKKSERD